MKVVDLVTRNTDQLSLHFSDFCTNLYRIYKFNALKNKKEKVFFFAQGPLEGKIFSQISPWPDLETGEAAGGRIPAWGLTGGGEEVGEKLHGVERNTGVGSVGVGVAGAGGAAESSGRRWR